MSLGIMFSLPFEKMPPESVEAIRADFATEFSRFEPVQMFTVNLGPLTPPPAVPGIAPVMAGFNLIKVKGDGSPARFVRAFTNVLSVNFFEYTSWTQTKQDAIGYLRRFLETSGMFTWNQARAILLRYVDRFIFDGPAAEANPRALFRSDTQFVALKILDTGYQWQSNSSWSENLTNDVCAQNQLNIQSALLPMNAVPPSPVAMTVAVIVDHGSTVTLPKQYASIADLFDVDGEHRHLEFVLDRQHEANTRLMKNLLNREMLDTIGLGG